MVRIWKVGVMVLQIGRTIFFDMVTGEVIIDTGEWSGAFYKKSVEEQVKTYQTLSDRNRETFDCIELEYGQYIQDFTESIGYRVNPETKTLEFSYPDTNEPGVEQPYQVPLSEQVASNMDYLLDVEFRLMKIEFRM